MINEMGTIEVKATEYQRLIKQSVKQKNAIQRVRELHKPYFNDPFLNCSGCTDDDGLPNQYPCPTIEALDGEQ